MAVFFVLGRNGNYFLCAQNIVVNVEHFGHVVARHTAAQPTVRVRFVVKNYFWPFLTLFYSTRQSLLSLCDTQRDVHCKHLSEFFSFFHQNIYV